jgi:hypothetical protein
LYQEVFCSGRESNFDECNHFESSNCDSDNQAAGVVCFNKDSKLMDVSMTTEISMTTDKSTILETSTTTETLVTTETAVTIETPVTTETPIPTEIPVTSETTSTTETTTLQPTQETTLKPFSRGNKFQQNIHTQTYISIFFSISKKLN